MDISTFDKIDDNCGREYIKIIGEYKLSIFVGDGFAQTTSIPANPYLPYNKYEVVGIAIENEMVSLYDLGFTDLPESLSNYNFIYNY